MESIASIEIFLHVRLGKQFSGFVSSKEYMGTALNFMTTLSSWKHCQSTGM